MEVRSRNVPPKRMFGRDITNLEQQRPKNNSICDKPGATLELRTKSRSFDKRAVLTDHRDPITEYEGEIFSFMLSIQVPLPLFRSAKRQS